MPLGAPTLWPETVKRVHATSDNETGILPKACTPSTWNGTPASRHRAASRATGWTTPISLFTHITLTTATPSASASRSEEHTSELQSQSNLVCRLLLEKKKKQ